MMAEPEVNLFERIYLNLEDDLVRLKWFKESDVNETNKGELKRKRQLEYVKYLISVATHPIGLRASVAPFNCSQEQMLAYIMKMFAISEYDVKDFMVGTSLTKATPESNSSIEERSVKARKLHSWRPQLRVLLGTPGFFYNKQLHLDNLRVRVYLFKGEKTSDTNQKPSKGNLSSPKSILDNIFKRFRLDSNALIRPVSEMRSLIKYESLIRVRKTLTNQPILRPFYRMTALSKEDNKTQNELRLNIRRYYCDPKSVYILRFEFWLESKKARVGCLDSYRSCIRSIVFNEMSSCCKKGNRSVYMNESQDFYGYINIRLPQVPSYPLKQNYPIFTLHEQKVNNCDISIEFKNRQLPFNTQQTHGHAGEIELTANSKEESVICHIRLYINCLLYQILGSLKRNYTVSGAVTLDNLFYLSAYTLINQHRLQNNLSLTEDKCLRRISILCLLIKLDHLSLDNRDKFKIFSMKHLLISVAQNEYLTASMKIDDKTMQEVDPFRSFYQTISDESLAQVVQLELVTLKDFISKFLETRLRKWLTRSTLTNDSVSERLFTLAALKMVKSSLSNLMKSFFDLGQDFQKDVLNLKSFVRQLICGIVLNHIVLRLKNVTYSDGEHVEHITPHDHDELSSKGLRQVNPWLELFNEIKYINNDICLHWSSRGLNGILLKEQEFVKNSTLFEKLNERECFESLQKKVENFVE